MASIGLKNVSLTSGTPLFQNLNLTIGMEDRIGLVAGNGGGKTSLLRCLAGLAEPTGGEIIRSRGLKIGMVQQDVPEDLFRLSFRAVLHQALPADMRDSDAWRVEVTLDEFEAPEALRDSPLQALSGGWQRLALIARVWINEPDMLLLDEPTNHLDLARVFQLEKWLTGLRNVPMVIASHDRDFLDACCNRTLFLRPGTSRYFALPYSRARAALNEADLAAEVQQERELKEASRLRKQAAKLTNVGINSGSDLLVKKSKYLRDRAEKIETTIQSLHKERPGEIRLANSGTHAKVLLAIEKAVVSKPGGEMLFSVEKFHLFQGDRVVLLGRNGAGKSLLVKLLSQAIATPGSAAGVTVSPSVVPGHLDQNLSLLPIKLSPAEFISGFGVGDQRCRSLLAAAALPIEKQTRPIGELSFGQRARLALLGLRLTVPNFYLLDEPTNHVDIPGQEMLESEIIAHGASAMIVSHDRRFVRNVGTRFLQIERKRLREVDGPEAFFAELARAGEV